MNSIDYKKDMFILLSGLAAIVLLVLLAFRSFSRNAFDHTANISRSRLDDFSWQTRETLSNELRSAERYIEAAAAAFSQVEDPHSPAAMTLLRGMHHNFSRLWILTPDGVALAPYQNPHDLSGEPYFPDLAAGNSGVSDPIASFVNQENVLCVYAPVRGRDGGLAGGVVGSYEIRELVRRTQKRRYSGTAVTGVIRQDGEYVFHSGSPFDTIQADNFIDFLRGVPVLDGGDPDGVARKLEQWGDGMIRFVHMGKNHVASFQPLGINKWSVLTTAPEDAVEEDSRAIDGMAATLVWRVLACLGAIIAGILYFGNKSRKAILRSNRLLDINNRRFRIAAFQLSNDVIEYDVRSDLVYRVNEDVEESKPIADLAGGLIRNERIAQDYLPALRDSMNRIRDGAPYESCVVKTERSGDEHGWYKVVFTGLLDDEQRPLKAVGTIEDVTRQRDTEIRFSLEEQQRRAMLSEAVESFVFNLTKERFLYGYDERRVQTRLRASPDYGRELAAIVAERIHPDSRGAALGALSAHPLREAFKAGRKRVETDLRAVDGKDGGPRWYNCLVNIVQDPESHDLMGYAYLRDITAAKLSELALQREAEQDPLTGLYNRQTTNRLIEEFLASPGALAVGASALLMIDLDRFKFVNDNYGHAAGDEVLTGMAEKLRRVVRGSDIVGRMGGDEFVVFLKGIGNLEMIRRRADEICRALTQIAFAADPDYRVSGSVGVALVSGKTTNLAELYEQADLALYAAKNRGKDQFALYEPTMRHSSSRARP